MGLLEKILEAEQLNITNREKAQKEAAEIVEQRINLANEEIKKLESSHKDILLALEKEHEKEVNKITSNINKNVDKELSLIDQNIKDKLAKIENDLFDKII